MRPNRELELMENANGEPDSRGEYDPYPCTAIVASTHRPGFRITTARLTEDVVGVC
ncbi:hypothetical protein ACLOJK_038892 [Asimina triloba]